MTWAVNLIPAHQRQENWDKFGNLTAVNGASRCECGCKYWEYDRCFDCNEAHDEERHDLS